MRITTETALGSVDLADPVTLGQIEAALRTLGVEVPLNDVRSVHLTPGGAEVVVLTRDDNGQMQVVGAGLDATIATVTIKVPVLTDDGHRVG